MCQASEVVGSFLLHLSYTDYYRSKPASGYLKQKRKKRRYWVANRNYRKAEVSAWKTETKEVQEARNTLR